MTDSDWGSWLIEAVEAADVDGLALWYLGCNGLILKASDGTTLYVDPYLGTGDPPRTVRMIPVPFDPTAPTVADAVVVTHEHTDHLHGPTQGPILAETGADLVAAEGCVDLARERDWAATYGLDDPYIPVADGDRLDIGGISITAIAGTDPDAEFDLAYVFEHAGHTVVHPGDGRPGQTLASIGRRFDVDLAVAAVGSTGMILDKETREPQETTWYNDLDDAVAIGRQLRATTLVPTHWDMWRGLRTDPHTVAIHARSVDHPETVSVLEIGDRYDL